MPASMWKAARKVSARRRPLRSCKHSSQCSSPTPCSPRSFSSEHETNDEARMARVNDEARMTNDERMTKFESAEDEARFWNDGEVPLVREEPNERRVYDLEERT